MKKILEPRQYIDPETGRGSVVRAERYLLEEEDLKGIGLSGDKAELILTALRGIAETQAVMMAELLKLKEAVVKVDTAPATPPVDATLKAALIALPHVGQATAKRMMAGYKSVPAISSMAQLAGMDWQLITLYPGVTDAEAKEIIKTAATLG